MGERKEILKSIDEILNKSLLEKEIISDNNVLIKSKDEVPLIILTILKDSEEITIQKENPITRHGAILLNVEKIPMNIIKSKLDFIQIINENENIKERVSTIIKEQLRSLAFELEID